MYPIQGPAAAAANTTSSAIRSSASSPPTTNNRGWSQTLQHTGWGGRNHITGGKSLWPAPEPLLGVGQDTSPTPGDCGGPQSGPAGGVVRRTSASQNPGLPFRQAGSPACLGSPTVSDRYSGNAEWLNPNSATMKTAAPHLCLNADQPKNPTDR